MIRPLIGCTRAEIEGYCAQNGLDYVTDSTNLSSDYSRNRLRLKVVPELRTINPAFEAAFARFFAVAAVQNDFVENAAKEALSSAKKLNGRLDMAFLSRLHEAVKTRALVLFFEENYLQYDQKKIALTCTLAGSGAVSVAKNTDIVLKDGELFFRRLDKLEDKPFCFDFKTGRMVIDERTELNITLVEVEKAEKIKLFSKSLLKNSIDCDKVSGNVSVRSKAEGDSVALFGRSGTKTLKKLFIDEKVPQKLRSSLPVVADAGGVLWVAGFGCDKRAAPTEATKAFWHLELITTHNNLLTGQ